MGDEETRLGPAGRKRVLLHTPESSRGRLPVSYNRRFPLGPGATTGWQRQRRVFHYVAEPAT
jgi:hypothetical protein